MSQTSRLMGFSFKKVFKKNEQRGRNILGGQVRGSGSDQEEEEEAPLPPPPLGGESNSPFEQVGDEGQPSPFDETPQQLMPTEGLGAAPAAGQNSPILQAFGGIGASDPPAAPEPDPAAAPLPTCHDRESAKELEDKGFRPLSSLPNPGAVPPSPPSMDISPNQPPSPDKHQAANHPGLSSPFEMAGSPPQTPQPPAPSQLPASPSMPSPFEIAGEPIQPTTPQAPSSPPAWQQASTPPQASQAAPLPPTFDLPPTGAVPIPSGPIPPSIDQPAAATSPAAPDLGAPPSPIQEEDPHSLPVGALDDPREFVEMNVQQLLGSVPPAELGMKELVVSPFAKTRIPMAMLKPQLPTGQVFLNVSDVIVGCRPEHRSELVGCDPTVRLRVPIALIFPAMGEAASATVTAPKDPPAAPAPPATPAADPGPGLFGAEAASAPADPAGGLLGVGAAPPATQESMPAVPPTSQPLPSAPVETESAPPSGLAPLGALTSANDDAADTTQPPAGPPEVGSGNASPGLPLPPLMPAGGGLPPTSLEPAMAPPQSLPEAMAPDATAQKDEETPGGWPFEESKNGAPGVRQEVVESLEDLPPVRADGEYTAPAGFEVPLQPADEEQGTLRALFLSEGKIDAQSVVDHCSALPGIHHCVMLGKEGVLAAPADAAGSFVQDAAKMQSYLQELVGFAGLDGDQPMTVRCGDAMASFFVGDGLAIGVHHESRGFLPGVGERLTIIARELGKLAG